MDRHVRPRASARDTPDKQRPVQSVQERVVRAGNSVHDQIGGRTQRFCRPIAPACIPCRRVSLDDRRACYRGPDPRRIPQSCIAWDL